MDFDKLRDTCLSFPGATEGLKWEDHLCFMVAEKMFCITSVDPEEEGVSMKVTPEDFDELVARPNISPQAYMAHNKWLRIEKYKALKEKEWQHYLRQSYDLIRSKLPKKIQRLLDEQ
jgi:predicted DNA-binding protein (MmcQ/YjbR family)